MRAPRDGGHAAGTETGTPAGPARPGACQPFAVDRGLVPVPFDGAVRPCRPDQLLMLSRSDRDGFVDWMRKALHAAATAPRVDPRTVVWRHADALSRLARQIGMTGAVAAVPRRERTDRAPDWVRSRVAFFLGDIGVGKSTALRLVARAAGARGIAYLEPDDVAPGETLSAALVRFASSRSASPRPSMATATTTTTAGRAPAGDGIVVVVEDVDAILAVAGDTERAVQEISARRGVRASRGAGAPRRGRGRSRDVAWPAAVGDLVDAIQRRLPPDAHPIVFVAGDGSRPEMRCLARACHRVRAHRWRRQDLKRLLDVAVASAAMATGPRFARPDVGALEHVLSESRGDVRAALFCLGAQLHRAAAGERRTRAGRVSPDGSAKDASLDKWDLARRLLLPVAPVWRAWSRDMRRRPRDLSASDWGWLEAAADLARPLGDGHARDAVDVEAALCVAAPDPFMTLAMVHQNAPDQLASWLVEPVHALADWTDRMSEADIVEQGTWPLTADCPQASPALALGLWSYAARAPAWLCHGDVTTVAMTAGRRTPPPPPIAFPDRLHRPTEAVARRRDLRQLAERLAPGGGMSPDDLSLVARVLRRAVVGSSSSSSLTERAETEGRGQDPHAFQSARSHLAEWDLTESDLARLLRADDRFSHACDAPPSGPAGRRPRNAVLPVTLSSHLAPAIRSRATPHFATATRVPRSDTERRPNSDPRRAHPHVQAVGAHRNGAARSDTTFLRPSGVSGRSPPSCGRGSACAETGFHGPEDGIESQSGEPEATLARPAKRAKRTYVRLHSSAHACASI